MFVRVSVLQCLEVVLHILFNDVARGRFGALGLFALDYGRHGQFEGLRFGLGVGEGLCKLRVDEVELAEGVLDEVDELLELDDVMLGQGVLAAGELQAVELVGQ